TELAGYLPVVTNIIALLEFASAHGIVELICLAHRARQTEQERCIRVEVVRGCAAADAGYTIDEIEASPRAPAYQLRLPVIHLVLYKVKAEPHIVRSLCPCHVRYVSVDTIIPLHRAPVVHVAERGVAGDVDDRETALPGIRTIRAGNLQYIG